MKRLVIVLSVIILFLLSVITWAPYFFHEKIETTVNSEIHKSINGKVTFSHLDISLWQNFPNITATLSDLSVSDSSFKDTLLKVSEMKFVIDAFDYILEEHINIISLDCDKPVLNAWISATGKNNFSILKSDTLSESSDTTQCICFRCPF